MREYNCRICGLFIEVKPWGDDNKTPTYEICPCCGVEFGNEDYTIDSIHKYRQIWLSNGANWNNVNLKPSNWSFVEQMKSIPDQYI